MSEDTSIRILAVAAGPDLLKAFNMEGFAMLALSRCDKLTDADRRLQSERPSLLLLDSIHHELSILEYCHSVRHSSQGEKLPIVILGNNAGTITEVEAFRSGASDFVPRPLNPEALLFRLLTRSGNPHSGPIELPKKDSKRLVIDTEGYAVQLDGKVVNLSRKEFELLRMLYSKPGRVFSREEIFEKVWKRSPDESDRTIDVHILRLRKKLGDSFISTQKGIGYRFTG